MQAIRYLKNYWWRFRWPVVLFLRRFAVTRAVLYGVFSPVSQALAAVRIERKKAKFLEEFPTASPGSAAWFVGTEIKYGGKCKVPTGMLSPQEARPPRPQEARGPREHEIGGDRMLHNGYAEKYAEYLSRYVGRRTPLALAEFGILRGTGLAIWSELFPDARILGFDIDLEIIRQNMDFLKEQGAFRQAFPELHECDQFNDNTEYLGKILNGTRLDVCIDDGHHSSESILMTMKSIMPHMADRFVCFIEDNPFVHKEIRAHYPHLKIDSAKHLTIVSRGV